MTKSFTLFLTLLTVGLVVSHAQNPISFTNSNNRLNNSSFHSGCSMSVLDVNGDGLDDIARLDGGHDLYFEIQIPGGTFQTIHALNVTTSSAWAMVVADVDNDGVKDAAVGYNGSAYLIKPNSTMTAFSQTLLPGSNYFLQNMNFADINGDGWNDLFGCNDNGASRMWGNNTSGSFPSTTNFFSTNSYPAAPNLADNNSGNYGSIWTDFDNDGDLDLYIAHCRQGISSTSDARNINQLFINDGNNNYVLDSFNTRGLNIGAHSWTSSFEDIDNDGDFDCLVTNHNYPSQILRNNGGGYFTDITLSAGFTLNVTPYQSKMADFDNDGFVDIIISGDNVRLYRNNGNSTFTLLSGLFDNNNLQSFAIGDLNHDGLLDVYSGYATGYTTPTNVDDVVWLNATQNANHFIAFNLAGTVSNRDAIGAKVQIFGSWGIQVREVRAGESYGTTNTLSCHFGLGSATVIDSAIITWPSGTVTRLYDKPADQFISVVEGGCVSPDNVISYQGATALCPGQSVTILSDTGYIHLWSTGSTSPSITVSQPGEYMVKLTDNNTGCYSYSRASIVKQLPDETPVITYSTDTVFCEGGSINLNSSFNSGGYLWNTGDTTQSITVNQSGTYLVTVHGACSDFSSSPLGINVVASHVNEPTEINICNSSAGNVDLTVSASGTVYWYSYPNVINPIDSGNTKTITVPNSSFNYYIESHDTNFFAIQSVGLPDTSLGAGSNFNGNTNAQVFDVYKTLYLKSVKVYTTGAKNRTIQLRSSNNTILYSRNVFIGDGEQTVELNFLIYPGIGYRLGWISGSTPDFFRSTDLPAGVYPSEISGLISITGNTVNDLTRWYAYYDWRVERLPLSCVSPRLTYEVNVVAPPVASIQASGPLTFCENQNLTLVSDTAASYIWSNGATTQQITINQAGSYLLTVSDAPGCSATATVSVSTIPAPNSQVSSDKPLSICVGDSVILTAGQGTTYLWSTGTTTRSIVISQTSDVWVSVTGSNSCSVVSDTIHVTSGNNATAWVTLSGNPVFCEGGSITLTANQGNSYQWSNSSSTQSITVSSSGVYTTTVLNGACTQISEPINVVVNSIPTVTISPVNSPVFVTAAAIQLNGQPQGGVFAGLGVNNGEFVPSSIGIGGPYEITYTYIDTNGCEGSNSVFIEVIQDTTMGITENYTDWKLLVYPNPSKGNFVLEFPDNNLPQSLLLFNTLGEELKVIDTRNMQGNKVTLQFGEILSKGVYYLVATNDRYAKTIRLSVQ